MESQKVEITMKEVYDKLIEIAIKIDTHPEKLEDHENRIRKLEVKVWTAAGASASLAGILVQIFNSVA
jgi:sulfur transfer protein SufE